MRVQGAGSVLSNAREQELAIFQYASRYHLGPRLYAVFDNGYVAEYVTGRVVKVDEMRESEMMKRIAHVVASWHALDIPSSVAAKRLIPWKGRKPLKTMSLEASTWQLMERWLLRAKRLYAAEDAVALAKGAPHTFDAFLKELETVQADVLPFYALASHAVVLCHNDFNHGNLLFDDARNVLFAVDLEFAGINHRGFDLGNHFCEWAGLDLLYHKCPSDAQMLQWILIYLQALGAQRATYCECLDCLARDLDSNSYSQRSTHSETSHHSNPSNFSNNTCTNAFQDTSGNSNSKSHRPSPASTPRPTTSSPTRILQPWEMHISKREMAQEMVIEARKWMQVSHLFWWLWAMIQIKISNVEGFNAKNYAEVRWAEYMKHKEGTLALKHPERLLQHAPSFKRTFPASFSAAFSSNSTISGEATFQRTHRKRSSSTSSR